MAGRQVKLTEFSDLISGYIADFVGREWLVKQVTTLLDDSRCRFIVLTGGPGVGKTAFLAHLAATHPDWPRYFIRRDSRDLMRPGDANTFLLTVGGQLASIYPHLFRPENLELVIHQRIGSLESGGEAIGAIIDELHASPFYSVALTVEQEIQRLAGAATALEIGRLVSEPRLLRMQDLQYLGLLDPARFLLRTDPSARIVVLVDALDELRFSPAEPDILRALCELPEVPSNLRFVVSSRPEAFLGRLLARADARQLPLEATSVDNRADLRGYIESEIAMGGLVSALEEEGLSPESFVKGLLEKTAGNFLYLKSVLGGIRETLKDPAKRQRRLQLLRTAGLPSDLDALYRYFLAMSAAWAENSGFGKAAWRNYLKPFLAILAVAREPLGEEQIAAFTGLERGDIRDLQREMRQFIEVSAGPITTYRIYHTSFADYLLDREHNRDYWIDEREVHSNIANHYLRAWGGLDSGLPGLQEFSAQKPEGGYGLRHLTAHLEAAGRVADLYQLLALENKDERNAWYEVREAAGDTAGYLADVKRAWQLAEEAGPLRGGERAAPRPSLQNRYALMLTSLNSLSRNVPIPLLACLVKQGIWPPERGLACAQQMPSLGARLRGLIKLLPCSPAGLKERVLQEALAAARKLLNELDRWDESLQELVLDKLLPHLPDSERQAFLQEALAAGRNREGSFKHFYRVDTLVRMAPYLPEAQREGVLRTVLAETPEIKEGWRCARALGMIAPLLPADLLQEALALARDITDGKSRVMALVDLALCLPEKWKQEVLSEAFTVMEETEKEDQRFRALTKIIPHLQTGPLLEKAFRIALEMREYGAIALAVLAPYLPETMLGEALAAAGRITDARKRASVLAALARRLPELPLRQEVSAARSIQEEWRRGAVLVSLAPHLPATLLMDALALARGIRNHYHRALALARIAPYLSADLREDTLREALGAARQFEATKYPGSQDNPVDPLEAMAAQLSEPLLREALKVLENLESGYYRAEGLKKLIDYLPDPLIESALAMALGRNGEGYDEALLARLAPRLDERQLRAALARVQRIDDRSAQAEALATLACQLPEPLACEALAALRELPELPDSAYGEYRPLKSPHLNALTRLASHLPERLLDEMLAVAQGLENDLDRDAVLAALAARMAQLGHARDGLSTARRIQRAYHRASALVSLVPHLPPVERMGVLRETLAVVWGADMWNHAEILAGLAAHLPEQLLRESFSTACEIERKGKRVKAMAALAPYLPEPERTRALEQILWMAGGLEYSGDLAWVLSVLAAHLPEPLLRQALTTAKGIMKEGDRYKALAALVPHLPEPVVQQALAAGRELQDETCRASLLAALLPLLAESERDAILAEVLPAARRLPAMSLDLFEWSPRASILAELAPYLPVEARTRALHEALAAGCQVGAGSDDAGRPADNEWQRRQILAKVAGRLAELPPDVLAPIWRETLQAFSACTRGYLLADLRDLAAIVAALGGPQAVEETFRAIQAVGRWWP